MLMRIATISSVALAYARASDTLGSAPGSVPLVRRSTKTHEAEVVRFV
jgi:hypothetical protein